MILWILSFFCLFLACHCFWPTLRILQKTLAERQPIQLLARIETLLIEIENQLISGATIPDALWQQLQALPEPWKTLIYCSLMELRNQGAALTPTLLRLRNFTREQQVALQQARAKSSQAVFQASFFLALIPILGAALLVILPELADQQAAWGRACLGALGTSSIGSLWLLQMTQNARWAGLPHHRRLWMMASQCAGERLLALVRTGSPPDLAWFQSMESLKQICPDLALAWGLTLWQADDSRLAASRQETAQHAILKTGAALKKAIQISLMEGHPCLSRIDMVLQSLRQSLAAHIEQELALLSTRALKPLMIWFAPSIIGLLGYGIYLGTIDQLDLSSEESASTQRHPSCGPQNVDFFPSHQEHARWT